MFALKLLSFSSNCIRQGSARQIQTSITQQKFILPTGISFFKNRNFSHSTLPMQSDLAFKPNTEWKFLNSVASANAFSLTKYSNCTSKYSTKAAAKLKPKEEECKITPEPEPEPKKPVVDSTNADDLIFGECSELTQFQKFKLMYKKYWYVLIPVHIVTSVSWVAGFYYLSKSGVDIPAALQFIHISDTIIEKVKHSNMGHYAIAYLCYKIITPFRYAVTLGITTISIKRLVFAGYIKPIPTKKEFIEMYEKNKAERAKRKEDKARSSMD